MNSRPGGSGGGGPGQVPPAVASAPSLGALAVQVGAGNVQVNIFGLTYTVGAVPPALVSGSGEIVSPYRGLNAFREEDARFFAGRDAAVKEMLQRMSRHVEGTGLLVVSGASGAGKSSLVRAGILPRLRGAGLETAPGAASWPCLVFTPGHAPLDELAVLVALRAGVDAVALRHGLAADPAGFALIARQAAFAQSALEGLPAAPPGDQQLERRLLVVVDQFEQVFTQCADEDERRAFIGALYAAARAGPGKTAAALVVLAVRADFETRCAGYPQLADAVQHRYLVTPMTRRQLRLAITKPAREAGSRVDRELVSVLLDEAGARQSGPSGEGVLPLLSHALDRAWRSRAGGSPLSLADYEGAGGIEKAVADSAQRAYDDLTTDQQAAAQQVFTRLAAVSSDRVVTASRATREELAGIGDVDAVLEAFAAERLLTLAADSVEISHEVVFKAWPRLRDEWLAEILDDLAILTRLRDAADEWERQTPDPPRKHVLPGRPWFPRAILPRLRAAQGRATDGGAGLGVAADLARRVQDRLGSWRRNQVAKPYLYRGRLLEAATETVARVDATPARYPRLTQAERDFLRASVDARRRAERLRQAVIASLAALALAAAVLALWANHQRDVANQQRDVANQQRDVANQQRDQAIENQIVAEAEQLSGTDPSLAAQLLLTAYRRDPSQDLASRLISTENQPLSVSERAGSFTVNSVAFSPDGKTFATGSNDNTVRLWDLTDPARPRQIAQPLPPGNGITPVSVAFSPDGKTLATGDNGGTVALWDVTDPARPRQLSQSLTASNGNGAWSLAFSPVSGTLATGGDDGAVRLWDVTDPARPRQLSQPLPRSTGNPVVWMAFSPDGKTLATASNLGAVRLWDVTDPARPRQIAQPGNGTTVLSAAFSADSKILATVDATGVVSLWDVTDPARPRQLAQPFTAGNTNLVDSAAFGPGGKTLAIGDASGAVRLWDVTDPARPRQLGQPLTDGNGDSVSSVEFSPDGKTLATGSDDGTVALWNLPATTLPSSIKGLVPIVYAVALSPNGERLAAGGYGGTVALWDVTDPARPRKIAQPLSAGNGNAVHSVAFSLNGKTLAIGDVSGAVRLWDVTDPALPHQLGQPLIASNGDSAYSVAFSPDGETLATGSNFGAVRLWDVTNPARPREIAQPLSTASAMTVWSVAFSPDGKTFAASADGTVRLWDVTNPARPRQLGQPLTVSNDDLVVSVAFGADGTLATGDASGTVTVWDVTSPARPRILARPLTVTNDNTVWSVAFTQDGKTLATGDNSGTVRLWDMTNPARPRQPGQPLTAGNGNTVWSVAFSPDGKTLAIGSNDGTVTLWSLDVNYAINRICHLASGALTPQQWHQNIPQLQYHPPCPDDR